MKRKMILAIVLIVAATVTIVVVKTQFKLMGKKIVMIIASRDFAKSEYEQPREIFEREGAKITVASSKLSEAGSQKLFALHTIKVKPDMLINDIQVKNYDAIVFIGGFGCAEYFDDPAAHKIAKEALEHEKFICAICLAPTILANAGVLQGKNATCYNPDNISSKGAVATGRSVERDGNIITANGPSAAKEFGETIVAALSE